MGTEAFAGDDEDPLTEGVEVSTPPASEVSDGPRKRKVGVTIAPKSLTKYRLKTLEIESGNEPGDYVELDALRPRKREDCEGGERPCPFVGCKYNMYLDVNEITGSITFNYPNIEPGEMKESCILDIADKGGVTLEVAGSYLQLTRERIRQLEAQIYGRLKNFKSLKEIMASGGFEHGTVKHAPSDEGEGEGGSSSYSENEDNPTEDFIFKSWRIYERVSRERHQGIRPRTLTKEEITSLVAGLLKTETIFMKEAPEAPEENKNMGRPLSERPLTEREQSVVDAYLDLAKKLGFKPKPSDVGALAGIKGLEPSSLSASVCTALKAATKKGIELPYFNEKRSKKSDLKSGDRVKVAPRAKSARPPKRGRKRQETIPPPSPVPTTSTAMVLASSPEALKSALIVQRETLEKKLAAINVLLDT